MFIERAFSFLLFFSSLMLIYCLQYFLSSLQLFLLYLLFFSLFQVRWFQQQHEKIRKKRDFQRIKFPGQSSARADPLSLLRSITSGSQIQYRSTDSHLIFPDPLFKEQWYLVSFFFFLTFFCSINICRIFIINY